MIDINSTCVGQCTPPQIVTFTYPINDITTLSIYNNCNEYDKESLQYSYSIDNVCWSCYMSYDEILSNTIELNSDFFVKIKFTGALCKATINGTETNDYDTQLVSGFNFDTEYSSNTYNPYANLEGALALQQALSDNVVEIVGIPIYYFKLSPNTNSKDITFKEYTLMDVESVKQLKLVIQDGVMPSSKPEFAEWGLDFQTDWEPEISKSAFATAFGNTAQPMEGDLVYIPMMKRMWMVNAAYEEKNGSLMWQTTTFKLQLSKYQEKGSVNLGDTESLVNSFVKNKYEDLFGEDSMNTVDSGEASTNAPTYAANSLYPVFESDATRKYVTCKSIDIVSNDIYYKGTLISDSKYEFNRNDIQSKVIYQKQYCGEELTISFILKPQYIDEYEGELITVGNIKINVTQNMTSTVCYIKSTPNIKIELLPNETYLCVLRISKCMNLVEFLVFRYTYNENIPLYKLQNNHYYFDMNNPVEKSIGKFNIEYITSEKSNVELCNYYGTITNFKLYDIYNDSLSDMLQMYPTHQHLIINDTARKIVAQHGVSL